MQTCQALSSPLSLQHLYDSVIELIIMIIIIIIIIIIIASVFNVP